jgi:hypothetical protein
LREIALYGATVWYDTNSGSHFHFYDEDAKLLFETPEHLIPLLNLPVSEGIAGGLNQITFQIDAFLSKKVMGDLHVVGYKTDGDRRSCFEWDAACL